MKVIVEPSAAADLEDAAAFYVREDWAGPCERLPSALNRSKTFHTWARRGPGWLVFVV